MLNQYIYKSKSFVNLKNDIAGEKLPHALILVGEDKVYLDNYAERLACMLLCNNKADGLPCGVCDICNNIKKGVHPDVIRFGKDSNMSSDDASKLIESTYIGPYSASRKIYILYNYDQINKTVENKLLKTLEEPPSYCTFILLASNITRLLQTTLSRVRKVYLEGLSIDALTSILKDRGIQDAELVAIQSSGMLEKAESYSKSGEAKELSDFVVMCMLEMNDTTSIVNFAHKFEAIGNHFDDIINYFAVLSLDAIKFAVGVESIIENKSQSRIIKQIAENISITALTKIIEATYKAKKMKESNVVLTNIIDQFLLKIVEVKIKCKKR